jgi:methionyl-tRNA formyltransferase
MKVIIFTNSNSNQIALVNKIHQNINIDAIITSKNITKKKINKTNFLKRTIEYLTELPFKFAWREIQQRYKQNFPTFPKCKLYDVDNINDEFTLKVIKKIKPSLIIVSGTNLIKNHIMGEAGKQCFIMNLHTGISPYVKGGPNCTNWCLANKEFYFIGNTIMELDIGIDSGKIIATEQTPLNGKESLVELHWKVMEHAHNLYIRAILMYINNKNIKTIEQDKIAKGSTFYIKDWRVNQKIKALIHYFFFYKKSFNQKESFKSIKTINLETFKRKKYNDKR